MFVELYIHEQVYNKFMFLGLIVGNSKSGTHLTRLFMA